MFNGEYNHTIDTKGRLIVPSKFREELGDQFMMTRGLDGCLFLFPMNEWHAYEEKLKKLLEYPDVVKKYKEEASDYICKKYSWENVVQETVKLY